MLIDFKIRALFIWTDPYLPDLINVQYLDRSLLSKTRAQAKIYLFYLNYGSSLFVDGLSDVCGFIRDLYRDD